MKGQLQNTTPNNLKTICANCQGLCEANALGTVDCDTRLLGSLIVSLFSITQSNCNFAHLHSLSCTFSIVHYLVYRK